MSGIKDRCPAFQVALWPRPSRLVLQPHLAFQLSSRRRTAKCNGHTLLAWLTNPATTSRLLALTAGTSCLLAPVVEMPTLQTMLLSRGMLHSPLKPDPSIHYHRPRYRYASISLSTNPVLFISALAGVISPSTYLTHGLPACFGRGLISLRGNDAPRT